MKSLKILILWLLLVSFGVTVSHVEMLSGINPLYFIVPNLFIGGFNVLVLLIGVVEVLDDDLPG